MRILEHWDWVYSAVISQTAKFTIIRAHIIKL